VRRKQQDLSRSKLAIEKKLALRVAPTSEEQARSRIMLRKNQQQPPRRGPCFLPHVSDFRDKKPAQPDDGRLYLKKTP
jgi:hypothetical protein